MPTYNRHLCVEDICDRIFNAIDKELFDLYIFDSSSDDNTYELVANKYSYSNCIYNRFDSSLHSNEKIYKIFQGTYFVDSYEYIWLLPDYMFFSTDVVDEIFDKINYNYEMIILDYWHFDETDDEMYSDFNKVFYDCAWFMSQYGVVILKSLLLDNINWNEISNKYLDVNRINFSHVGLYFESLCMNNHCSILRLKTVKSKYYKSSHKPVNGLYNGEMLHVWLECWPNTIMALPDCYLEKKEVIKSEVYNVDVLNEQLLINLRSKGLFSLGNVLKKILMWSTYSTCPTITAFAISIVPKSYARFCCSNGGDIFFIRHYFEKCKLKKFCKSNDNVLLYGAGTYAKNYLRVLQKEGITISSVVVTNTSDFYEDGFLGYPVCSVDNVNEIYKSGGIILALNKANREEVKCILKNNGINWELFEADYLI